METEQMEESLNRAIEAMVPDHCEELLTAPVEPLKAPDDFTRHQGGVKKTLYKMAGMAAGILLLLAVGGIWRQTQDSFLVVSIDVNPGLELQIDRENRISGVRGVNEEGKELAERLKLSGAQAEKAAASLAEALCELGYLAAGQENYLLFSAEGKQKEQKGQVEKQMLASIQNKLLEQKIQCEIIRQDFKKSPGTERTAKTYGITAGKARLVEVIYEQTQAAYTQKELAAMTIQQLSGLLKKYDMDGKDGLTTVTGTSKAGEQKESEDSQKPRSSEEREGTGTSGQGKPESGRFPADSADNGSSGEEEEGEREEDLEEEEEDLEEEEDSKKAAQEENQEEDPKESEAEEESEEDQRKGELEEDLEEKEDQRMGESGEDTKEEEDQRKDESGEDLEEVED